MSDEKPQNPWEQSRPNNQQKAKSDLEALMEMARHYQKNSGGGNGGGANNNQRPQFGFPQMRRPVIPVYWIIAGIIIAWLATGFYQVRPDQQGVVMRFGKQIALAQPGLNYHLPYPFETVLIPNVTRENQITVGFNQRGADNAEESLMLTGDENIVDVDFVVTWQVKDIGKFLFRVRDPEGLAKMASESVMREIVGQNKIQDVLTSGRQSIEARAQEELQQLMDEYQTGILITRVNLRDAAPPQQVVDAFREVQRAQADAEQLKNQALAYQNDILPRARGEAERLVQEASGYKESVVAKASGEAQRFNSVYNAYQGAKEVTQKRMYLETMEEIYSNAKRIVIDKNAGANTVVPLMLPQTDAGKMSVPANPVKGATP